MLFSKHVNTVISFKMKSWIIFFILISLANASQYNKLLVTANLRNASSFVLDLENQKVCGDFPDFPMGDVAGASGGLLKQKYPFVCNGNGAEAINQCYLYQDGQWTNSLILPPQDIFSRMVTLNETTVWITGGFGNSSLSILVSPIENRIVYGPKLRTGVIDHCMVNIDGNNVFIISGDQHYRDLRRTQIYTFSSNAWQDGPDLLQTALVPACALVTLSSGKRIIVLVDDLTTQYLELGVPGRGWRYGPPIPYYIPQPAMVSIEDNGSALLFGFGTGTKTLKYHCSNGDPNACSWTELDLQLPFEAVGPVTMLIPDEIAPSCN